MTDEKTARRLAKLKETLCDTLDFLEEAITEDLETLKKYKELHGDLKYRPYLGPDQWGSPTDTVLEPIASKYRTTIKTLVDTIAVIEGKIVGDTDDPENPLEKTYRGEEEKRNWSAKDAMRKAKEEAERKKQEDPDLDDE